MSLIRDRYNTPVILVSQAIAILGNVLMAFSLGVWAYQKTGSVTVFGGIVVLGYLPELMISPLAGVLIDRYPRKAIIFLCCCGQALVYCWLLFSVDAGLTMYQAYIAIALASIFGGCHRIAYSASIALFSTDAKAQSRLNGMAQLSLSSAHLIAPIVAGFMMEHLGLESVGLIAVTIFSIAAFLLIITAFPELSQTSVKQCQVKNHGLVSGLLEGGRYLYNSPGLRSFLALHACANFTRASIVVLFTPLILSFSNAEVLGTLRSSAGAGMAIGALMVSLWGGPENRLSGVVMALSGSGVFMSMIGIFQDAFLIGVSVLGLFSLTSIMAASANTIWQQQVDKNAHGRVFGFRDAIAGLATVFAYIGTPFFTEKLVVPAVEHNQLMQGNALSSMYLVMGLITILLAIVASKNRQLLTLNHP